MTLTNPSHIFQGWVCWGPCDLHREEKLTAKDIFRSNEASLEISAAMELRKCSAGIRSDNVRLVETESKMDGGEKRRVLLITCCCFRCYDSLFSRWQRENIRTFLLFLFFFFLSQKLRLLLSSGLLLFLLSLETFNPRHFHTARGICHHQPTYSHAHLLTYKPLKQMNKHPQCIHKKRRQKYVNIICIITHMPPWIQTHFGTEVWDIRT